MPVKAPANALQRCVDLWEPEGSSMGHITVWAQEAAMLYGECRARHDALVDFAS